MSNEVTDPDEKPHEAESGRRRQVLLNVPSDVVLVLPHRELRPHEVPADEEAMAEHFYQAGQLRQRSLLLVLAQLLLKKLLFNAAIMTN